MMRMNTLSKMAAGAVSVALLSFGTAREATAQPATASGTLASALLPGSTVWITDATGREERLRVDGFSGGVATFSAGERFRRIDESDILRVRARRSDSVWNGALIGAGAAVGTGVFMCRLTEPWDICDNPSQYLRVGAVGAGIGIGIDALIRGRKTIYQKPHTGVAHLLAAPLIGRGGGGLQLSITF
jgi:hypothetical protein